MRSQTMSSSHALVDRPGLRVRVAAAGQALGRVPLALHQLVFRFAVALVFFRAGLLKASSWESTVALFQDEYKVPGLPPELAAAMATTVELTAPALLMVGFLTRLATLPLLGMIATIQLFVYPQAWGEHLVWGAILGYLLTRGAGAVSLDHLFGLEAPGRADG